MDDFSQDTPETAAVKLAERLVKGREKRAFGMSDVGNWLSPGGTPDASHWLAAGAGLGGIAGLASSYNRDKDERRPFSSAVTGALAGGAALGGGALFAPQLQSLWGQMKSYLPSGNRAQVTGVPAQGPPPDLRGAELRAWAGQHNPQVRQWMQSGTASPEQLKDLHATPGLVEQYGPEVGSAIGRGATGYAVGASLDSAGRTLVNPLGRGAAALGKDHLPHGGEAFLKNEVGLKDQARSLYNALQGAGRSPNVLAEENIAQGLTNTGARSLWRAGARTPFQAAAKSGPGFLLGGAAAVAPYAMRYFNPVTPEELGR